MTSVDQRPPTTAAVILSRLPAHLPWAVLFRLQSLRPLCDDDLLRQAFKLPEGVSLTTISHVLLTPAGPVLCSSNGGMTAARTGEPAPHVGFAQSLAAALSDRLTHLPPQEPACLGYGGLGRQGVVLLHVTLTGTRGEAITILPNEPGADHFPLLAAVGAESTGGHWENGAYVAHFSIDLGKHLLAGALANFSRTDHCNEFFLRGCAVTPRIAEGLQHAAEDRITHVRRRLAESLAATVHAPASATLLCVPPVPQRPYPYGDLVPLGFVLAGLRAAGDPLTADTLEGLLATQCRDGLWSYHRNGLVTAIDSALILQGMHDSQNLAALERFRAPSGWYVPQAFNEDGGRGVMSASPEVRHWCQPDLPTTYLITGLRRRAGLPVDLDLLANRFDERSGLFFANPYFVDWALAGAVGNLSKEASPTDDPGPQGDGLGRRLASEILSSMRADHSFGAFDPVLSSALALAALRTLGVTGHVVTVAKVRLADTLATMGTPPTPFYSSLLPASDCGQDGDYPRVALTWYRDEGHAVTAAVAALALADSEAAGIDAATLGSGMRAHPRYLAHSAEDYVTRFALPPYLQAEDHGKETAHARR
jgi:hypothetical protein